jgi:hypothetical protein
MDEMDTSKFQRSPDQPSGWVRLGQFALMWVIALVVTIMLCGVNVWSFPDGPEMIITPLELVVLAMLGPLKFLLLLGVSAAAVGCGTRIVRALLQDLRSTLTVRSCALVVALAIPITVVGHFVAVIVILATLGPAGTSSL